MSPEKFEEMRINKFDELRLRDPLNEVTRRERRYLLGISTVGIAITKTGLIPSKISALGIEFGQTDKGSLLIIIGFIVIYYLAAFIIYSSSDYLSRKLAIGDAIDRFEDEIDVYRKNLLNDKETNESINKTAIGMTRMLYFFSSPVSVLRMIFEFILPVILGLYACYLLFNTSMSFYGS